LAFFGYWYRKKRLEMHFEQVESKRSLQNSPLESSSVVVSLTALNSTSKPLNVSPEKIADF